MRLCASGSHPHDVSNARWAQQLARATAATTDKLLGSAFVREVMGEGCTAWL